MTKKKEDPKPSGRPPKYKTVEEFQKKIDEYFEDCPDKRKVISANGITVEVPCPTIPGIAYHLGFESRQSFYDYEERPEFSYSVKRARIFIEKEYAMMLQNNNVTGIIFALKNMGWSDKVESENINHDDIVLRWEKD